MEGGTMEQGAILREPLVNALLEKRSVTSVDVRRITLQPSQKNRKT